MRKSLREQRARIICRSKCRVPANGVVPVLDAREVLPSGRLIEIGHADDRRHQRDVGERDLTAEQPRSAALFELRIHALVRAAQPLQRGIHLFLRETGAAHGQHELLAQRPDPAG